MDDKRLQELKAKAEGPGLSDAEAAELGRLYAEAEGKAYANADSVGSAEELAEEEIDREGREEKEGERLKVQLEDRVGIGPAGGWASDDHAERPVGERDLLDPDA